jgi:hypothetical protein
MTPIPELVDRLFLPIGAAVVLLLGTGAYLLRRSMKIDAWTPRSDEETRARSAAQAAVAAAGRILGLAAFRALLLLSLLFGGVALLNHL